MGAMRSGPEASLAGCPSKSERVARSGGLRILDADATFSYGVCGVEAPVFMAAATPSPPAVLMRPVGEARGDVSALQAQNELISRWSISPGHMRHRKTVIASRPLKRSARLRQRLSGLLASAARPRSRLLRASSASRTFDAVVSRGWGGRSGRAACSDWVLFHRGLQRRRHWWCSDHAALDHTRRQ